MANEITQEMYRDQWVVRFQRGETPLKESVTREEMIEGNQAVFPIQSVSSGMVERGVNGLIPSEDVLDTQIRIPLTELHRLEKRTSFNIFTGHADTRMAMQNRGALAAAREIDDRIISGLNNTTSVYNNGEAITLTSGLAQDITSSLMEQDVYSMDGVTALWTPKAYTRLRSQVQVVSRDYVDMKLHASGYFDQAFYWNGVKHMSHTGLPNMGTATATCFVFAKAAIGHAVNADEVRTAIDYNSEQDYSFARHTIFHGAQVLQNEGILKITHDDTAAIS